MYGARNLIIKKLKEYSVLKRKWKRTETVEQNDGARTPCCCCCC